MSEYDTGNPVPSASMPDAWDNMQSIDKFVNSSDETITTRTGEQLDTLHGVNVKADNQLTQQQADFETSQEERDAVVEETRQNLIPLSRQYMTLAAAQADIANIPEGSATYVRSADGSSLADEYINNAGTLEATGRKMGAKQLDLTAEYPAAVWLPNCSVSGNSGDAVVTVNKTSATQGVCVLISVRPGETVYIGNPADADRFRMLDLPAYPENGMTRAGSRYTYNADGTPGPDDFTLEFDSVLYSVKPYTTAGDAQYILVYQSSGLNEYPVVFSEEKTSGYRKLTGYAGYHVNNDLTFSEITKSELAGYVFSSKDFPLVANSETAKKLTGYELAVNNPPYTTPWLNSNSNYGRYVITWVAPVTAGKRYTLISVTNETSPRFRVAGFEKYPSRRGFVTHMYNGLTVPSTRQTVTENNGVSYSYITLDILSDAAGTDNWLAMNLTDDGSELPFALIEGDFVPGQSYRVLAESVDIGVPVSIPVGHIGQLTSDIIVRGKNLFDGNYIYGYSDTANGLTTSDYTAWLNVIRQPGDSDYQTAVAAVIPCQPNTKYAVSRSGGGRFRIGLSKSALPTTQSTNAHASPMKIIVADDSASTAVITTGADDKSIFVYLSNTGGVNWLQVEEGDTVTYPERYGWKFSPAAEAIQQVMTSGAGYISAGAGDGVTDDADSLQSVLNLITGVISFDPTKRYRLGKTLSVNAATAKALVGNRATFIVDGNFPAFTVTGSMTSGSASPSTNGPLAKSEGGFLIDGIRAYGATEGVGSGLALSGMFKPRINNCDLLYLDTAVRFSNLNRDVILTNNNIYACKNYGLHFDSTANIHQLNILGNIITYCKRNIFLDDAAIYNIQIGINDIELGAYPDDALPAEKADIWVDALTKIVEDLSATGNTLEDHWTSNQLIKLNGAFSTNIVSVNIAENSTGNSLIDDVVIGGASGVNISGQFKQSYGYAVRVAGNINGMKLSAQVQRSGGAGGLLAGDGNFVYRNINVNGSQLSGDGASGAIAISGAKLLSNVLIGSNGLYDKAATSIKIQSETLSGLRVDMNNINNEDATGVTNAVEITASTVSGKNSVLLNSATTGAFVAPDGFNVQGNF